MILFDILFNRGLNTCSRYSIDDLVVMENKRSENFRILALMTKLFRF